MRGVEEFFNAKTFAVVGASRNEKKVGHAIFKNLLLSGKKVVPVNPNADKILGHKAFKDLLEVPYNLDCLIIAIPAQGIPYVMLQAQKKKVKCAVILSAGFSEAGNKNLEGEVMQIAENSGIKVLGPNAYGFINPKEKLNTTFYRGMPKPGKIAFISQSGAIGSAILDKIKEFSGFVSIGDSAQTDFSDFVEYYSNDKETEVITLYIESLKEGKGQRFIEVCKKCKKPIIALKAGKSKQGQLAAKSHTAALASEFGVYSGIFRQAGIIEVDDIRQLFTVAKIFQKYKKLERRAIVITNAGGLGVLTADACTDNKIELSPLSKNTLEKLNQILPSSWSKNNPADLLGDALAKDYENAIKILEGEDSDFFIVLLTPQYMSEPLETAKILSKLKKPVFACFLGGDKVKEAKEYMEEKGIITFDDVREMCETIGKVI